VIIWYDNNVTTNFSTP